MAQEEHSWGSNDGGSEADMWIMRYIDGKDGKDGKDGSDLLEVQRYSLQPTTSRRKKAA